MKFPPGEANSEIKWISLLYGNPGNAAACALAVGCSAVTLWFCISQTHVGPCPSADWQGRTAPGLLLAPPHAGWFQGGRILCLYQRSVRGTLGKWECSQASHTPHFYEPVEPGSWWPREGKQQLELGVLATSLRRKGSPASEKTATWWWLRSILSKLLSFRC